MREQMRHSLRDMSAIIKDYRMIDCEDPIVAEHEFNINGNNGRLSGRIWTGMKLCMSV